MYDYLKVLSETYQNIGFVMLEGFNTAMTSTHTYNIL